MATSEDSRIVELKSKLEHLYSTQSNLLPILDAFKRKMIKLDYDIKQTESELLLLKQGQMIFDTTADF